MQKLDKPYLLAICLQLRTCKSVLLRNAQGHSKRKNELLITLSAAPNPARDKKSSGLVSVSLFT